MKYVDAILTLDANGSVWWEHDSSLRDLELGYVGL
jgi:hypothetical protein